MSPASRSHRLVATLMGAALLSACGTLSLLPAAKKATQGARTAASTLDNPLDGARALAHTRYLTDAALAGRGTATAGDYKADDYIVREFEKLGLPVIKQAFQNPRFKGTAHNVIALLPGSERSNRYLVVGAHKDHLGVREGKMYPGANDNAGGTAAVLEIARVMVDRNQNHGDRPRANILFMTFSGEELGLLGSTYYTKNPVAPKLDGGAMPIPLSAIKGMVNMDCIAVGNTNTIGTDAVEDPFTSRGDLSAMATQRGLKMVFKPFKIPHTHEVGGLALPPWASSDHAAFRRAGVRAICYYAEPVMSKYLHTPNDTLPERDTIDKKPADQFNIDNLVRIAAVAYDTLKAWSNE
ncbi:MAG: M28 family peptidase [Candidatus Sericytochromatia bacterium]|nr:M28 family peptidase [Candidatus Sericytochromatia bacterium]